MLTCVGSRAMLGSALPGHILQRLSPTPCWSRNPGYSRVWESNPLGSFQQPVCGTSGCWGWRAAPEQLELGVDTSSESFWFCSCGEVFSRG